MTNPSDIETLNNNNNNHSQSNFQQRVKANEINFTNILEKKNNNKNIITMSRKGCIEIKIIITKLRHASKIT